MNKLVQNKKKAAFIKNGDFSHINLSVLEFLKSSFPHIHFDVIDIAKFLSKKDLLAVFYCLKEYRLDVFRDEKKISRAYRRTPYAFEKIKRAILNKLSRSRYLFTFQTQSLFDLSLPGVPHFVYTDHTHLANLSYPGFDKAGLFSLSWIECEKKIYHTATHNFTMSSNISRSIINDYSCPSDKVSCVYCGANVHAAEDELFSDARYSKKNILFVGIDWQRKGGPILVEAFKHVLKTHPTATLTVVGCSPEINLPNCHIVGKIPPEEVKQYFKNASIFCLPTMREPFGIVFLEAMAHKLPIVATNIGAIPDFIYEGKNGYKVEPGDAQGLSKKIIDLIGSEKRCKSYGEFGHQLLWSRYTWEGAGIRIKNVIENILF